MSHDRADMQIVLITGTSGSGKSVALHAFEDLGFYCVDNLPPELLLALVDLPQVRKAGRLAIAIDVRSAASLPLLPQRMEQIRACGIQLDLIFLDASTATLSRRFSETRRRHPLSGDAAVAVWADQRHALAEAIEVERELLGALREQAHVIDSSVMHSAQLQTYVKNFIAAASSQLTLVFESFAFKRGTPMDADFVFDVRMLPNPYYDLSLRALSGQDAAVASYLADQPQVQRMIGQIQAFLDNWIEDLAQNHRSYLTVAIGCTGGQHRSVYLVEQLARLFQGRWVTLKRHRELDAAP